MVSWTINYEMHGCVVSIIILQIDRDDLLIYNGYDCRFTVNDMQKQHWAKCSRSHQFLYHCVSIISLTNKLCCSNWTHHICFLRSSCHSHYLKTQPFFFYFTVNIERKKWTHEEILSCLLGLRPIVMGL